MTNRFTTFSHLRVRIRPSGQTVMKSGVFLSLGRVPLFPLCREEICDELLANILSISLFLLWPLCKFSSAAQNAIITRPRVADQTPSSPCHLLESWTLKGLFTRNTTRTKELRERNRIQIRDQIRDLLRTQRQGHGNICNFPLRVDPTTLSMVFFLFPPETEQSAL